MRATRAYYLNASGARATSDLVKLFEEKVGLDALVQMRAKIAEFEKRR